MNRIKRKYFFFVIILTLTALISCNTKDDNDGNNVITITKNRVPAPEFNEDSAYQYIEQQLSFGPRVPNTNSHKKCAEYLHSVFNELGLETIMQEAEVKDYRNQKLKIYNINARYQPKAQNRIVLFAHWDSRRIADRDSTKINDPILGANDGASGVGVILEIARAMVSQEQNPNVGVDFVLLDAEDQGQPNEGMSNVSDSWCLGAQYWSKNIPFGSDYSPDYGILLDMVGATDATFPKEGHSIRYAPDVVEKVWDKAAELGYSKYFVYKVESFGITDDHYYINSMAQIPTIDIIHYNTDLRDFGHFHHRHSDNLDIIDKSTLKAVGQTVLEVLYSEN